MIALRSTTQAATVERAHEWDEAKNRSNLRGDGSCPARARGDAHDALEKGEPK
ncbi:MAG: hypothetical protein IPP12_20050 [Nitrospira sp.]|nr:hypothetical protein [Nitrospira sp.]